MTAGLVRFVHISDTHLGPSADFSVYGVQTLPCLERLIEAINALPIQPDFVIHTGDLADQPNAATYRLAAEAFARLEAPAYFVTGNHDDGALMAEYMAMGPKVDLSADQARNFYRFELQGQRFLVLDARGPDEIDPHGILAENQLGILRQEAETGDGAPLSIFLHFPAHEMDCAWVNRDMLLLNGGEFHQALLPLRERLRGVFIGHVHHGVQTYRDGVLYSSVASHMAQFPIWPEDATGALDPNTGCKLSFNLVSLLPEQTIVKEYAL